jgi:hypothetical protein
MVRFLMVWDDPPASERIDGRREIGLLPLYARTSCQQQRGAVKVRTNARTNAFRVVIVFGDRNKRAPSRCREGALHGTAGTRQRLALRYGFVGWSGRGLRTGWKLLSSPSKPVGKGVASGRRNGLRTLRLLAAGWAP